MTIEILSSPDSYLILHQKWNSLIQDDPEHLRGADPTSSFEWFASVLLAFPEASESFVVVARERQEIVGILPVIVDRSSSLGPRLLAPTELYGGRNGLVVGSPDGELLDRMIGCFSKACPGWTSFQFTLVDGSKDEQRFLETFKQQNYGPTRGVPQESPFFSIPVDSESLFSGMAKDLKQRIRSGERKLTAQGALTFRRYTRADEARELIETVMLIERNSWKSDSGTAITNSQVQERFYREFLLRAAQGSLLYAQVLLLDSQPIAYLFGLRSQGVFVDLKNSFAKGFEAYSAAHINRYQALLELRKSGCITYDFMGANEAHKLRWSNNTQNYVRHTWTLYNRSIGGIVLGLGKKLKAKLHKAQAIA